MTTFPWSAPPQNPPDDKLHVDVVIDCLMKIRVLFICFHKFYFICKSVGCLIQHTYVIVKYVLNTWLVINIVITYNFRTVFASKLCVGPVWSDRPATPDQLKPGARSLFYYFPDHRANYQRNLKKTAFLLIVLQRRTNVSPIYRYSVDSRSLISWCGLTIINPSHHKIFVRFVFRTLISSNFGCGT